MSKNNSKSGWFVKKVGGMLPWGSQALHLLLGVGECCRYQPTCSEFGRQALCDHGFWQGLRLTGKRILKCVPGRGFGFDPVPPPSA